MKNPTVNAPRRALFRLAGTAAATAIASPSWAATGSRAAGTPLVHSSKLTADPCTYYDLIEPAGGSKKPPMLLISGGAHSGSCYLSTADGRPGWAYAFARRGYKVAVADWAGCGRSGYVPNDKLNGEMVVAGLGKVLESLGQPAIVMTHSMSGAYGWKLLEKYGQRIAKVVGVAPSPPGNIQTAPEILQETEETIDVQLFKGGSVLKLSRKTPFVSSRGFVDQKLIGASKLFPRDSAARYAASLIAIPPRLILERVNIGGSQLKVSDFSNYAGKRVLILTGTDDIDHPVNIDKPIADWLNENGAKADFLYLGDKGINGNGHMMMLESNSDALAGLIASWIEKA